MATVTIDYWTNLCRCFGSNVGGSCTIEMTDEELALFREVNEQAIKDGAKNIIMYFDGKLPDELKDNIDYEIYQSLSRIEAEDAIDSYGIECFLDMSEEEYDELSREELIERCMEESDGVLDFSVVEIKIL
jgi:hypothetical protein